MYEPIRVLYVDDYPLDRELVRDALEKEHGGFRVTEAASRQEFETRLAEGDYDLILSDFNILGFEGLEVIDAVRAKDPQVPVVIVTGTGSEEIAVAAMKRGAADYVIKRPAHIRRLPHIIQAVMEKKRLQDERQRAEEALRESEQRLTVALKNAPMVVAHVDKDLRYTWIHNPHPDFKPEDVIGKRDDQLAKTEGTFRFMELKRQVLDGGIPARREISFMLSDRERVYDIYAEPKPDSTGKIIGLTTAALDITERKRAE
ncbi:MAG: response regulator, partial [Anaerolineales bacterium]|nr:response regulator [Anaerolineales bacterium]